MRKRAVQRGGSICLWEKEIGRGINDRFLSIILHGDYRQIILRFWRDWRGVSACRERNYNLLPFNSMGKL